MNNLYAMQRANGDWFAMSDQGHLRVPVFRSSSDAMQARARHSGMFLFKPVLLDELRLKTLASGNGGIVVDFGLVDHPSTNLMRSPILEYAQLALLCRAQQPVKG